MRTISACPDEATIIGFLLRLRAACKAQRVQVTTAAAQDAEDIGYDFAAILAQLQTLRLPDFEKRVSSTRRPDDQVWVFCPEALSCKLWIRLIERGPFIVVSFHEK